MTRLSTSHPPVRQWHNKWAEIDLDAIIQNVTTLKSQIGGSQLFLVVKANGLGHGAIQTARAAIAHGATWLGVATAAEGIQLRRAGIGTPILVLGTETPHWITTAIQYNLTLTITDSTTLVMIDQIARGLGLRASVHVQLDTGLHRFGLSPADIGEFIGVSSQLTSCDIEGVYTHLALTGEADSSRAEGQLQVFTKMVANMKQAGLDIPLCHAGNSSIIGLLPHAYLDMVRVGCAIYGIRPKLFLPTIPLLPALALKTRIVRLAWLPKDAYIGYGSTFQTQAAMRIATLPLGYADGLQRGLSRRGSVLIRGQKAPIVGNIAMDYTMVDVTHIEGVLLNDQVVIIGSQDGQTIPIEEHASCADIFSPEEVSTGLSRRVPRFYFSNGVLMDMQED